MSSPAPMSGAGIIAGILGAVSFGFIPVFSKPALEAGYSPSCILFYRFAIATLILAALLLSRKQSMRLPLRTVPSMFLISLFYCVSGGFLVLGYKYMSGGVAGVLHFTYPVFVMSILVIFYKERIKISSIIAIIIAIAGIYCLGVLGGESSFVEGQNRLLGVVIILTSGLGCACYMVGVNKTKCRHLSSLNLTFWLILFSTLFFGSIALFNGELVLINDLPTIANFVGLALIATVLSNFLLVYAIKKIGSTYAAIFGAVEPLTAVILCIIIFGETINTAIVFGILFILVAVTIVVLRNKK